jgi:PAS domain S-box-containing protein
MRSRASLRLRIIAVGAVLISAFIGSAAYDGWRLHQQIVAANDRELGNLAKALSEEASRSFQAVDVLLRDTAVWYMLSSSKGDAEAMTMALASRAVGVSQVSVLTIIDAHGKQLYRSRPTGEPLADVTDRPYFQVQRDTPTAGLYINAPIVTRTERVPALVVSRRINDRDGNFDGVVTAIVTLQQFRSAYSALDLGPGSALLLTLGDGTLVVRQPSLDAMPVPMKFPELIELKGGSLVDRAISPMDGRLKLIASVGVANQTLVLAVTRDEEQALRPWFDEMWSATIRTVLLSLLVVLTIAGLLRQLKRQELGDAALRKSEERYAMAMEAANEGHAEWNMVQDDLFASDKWRGLHGLAPKELTRNSEELRRRVVLHPEDAPLVKAALDDHFAGRTHAIEIDYRVQWPDGEWHWIHARGRCLLGDDGAPIRLFCSAVDVSERKRAESEKAGLEARLQQTQRLEALGTLAGGIAHDFNNILGAILGFGEMAQHRAEPGTALRRHIDRVMQSGARARLLVRRILDFSRSGIAEHVQVNLQGVLEEVVAMLAPSLPQSLVVQTHLNSGDAAVIGDATQLYQVAMNLCTNAVQAMGEEGLIEIRLERAQLVEPRSFLHGDLPAGDYVRLDVADTGPGIEPEVLARMFDPFFTTKKVGEGTGLGLSVVHGIVAGVGGAIDVVAREPKGTVVSVWLPIAGELAPQSVRQADEWPAGNGEVVMIVDDERALVDLAEELLAGLGYEPVGFDSSTAALQAFEADPTRFDAVITDLMLPGLQGTQLARLLLAIRPDLPILLMSGNLSDAAEQAARDAGVRATLHKPLALSELAERLSKLLQRNG